MCTQRGGSLVTIMLTTADQQTMERWVRRPSTSQVLTLRSRIVLAAVAGQENVEIGAALGCHPVTAGNWRRRIAEPRFV